MEKTKRNQYILLSILAILVLIVVSFTIYSIIQYQNDSSEEVAIKFNQIYSSDYNLSFIDDNYIIGYYEDKTIDKIIDNNGKEVFTAIEDISYQGIYKMKNNMYLIYNTTEKELTTYIFDGKEVNKLYDLNNVSYAKPLVMVEDNIEYIVGFFNVIDNNLYIYKLDGSNAIIIEDGTLQTDDLEQGIYYINNDKYLTIKNSEGKSGIIDFDGNVIIDYLYEDIISTSDDKFIVLDDKGRYSIIDKDRNVLLKNTKIIKKCSDYYLVVNNSNKMALFDKEFNNLTGYSMNYDTIIEYDLRNTDALYCSKFNGAIIIVNNYLEDMNGTQYKYHNLYIYNNDKISKTIEQKGFFLDTLLFVYNKEYEITIFDENYSNVGTISLSSNVSKIENIELISSNIIMIKYIDLDSNRVIVYYDRDGNDITIEYKDYGLLVENNYLYHAFLKQVEDKRELMVYNYEHKISGKIDGDKIEMMGEYLIVDHAIYKMEIIQ